MVLGGWANNPDASMLKNTMKTILFAKGVNGANKLLTHEAMPEQLDCDMDHDFGSQEVPLWCESVLGYMAGYVVKKTLRKSSCTDCSASMKKNIITRDDSHVYTLLSLKNNGGLVIPQQWVISAVTKVERIIRRFVEPHTMPTNPQMTIARIRLAFYDEPLPTPNTDICKDHHTKLIDNILAEMIRLRMHSISHIQSSMMHTVHMRQHNLHATIFQGQ